MSIAYAYVGVRHFIDPDFFLAIMPNYLTFHLEFVYLSGVAEVVLGLMLLSKKTRKTLKNTNKQKKRKSKFQK